MSTKTTTIARRPGYRLTAEGKLYTTGEYGFFVGYVSDPENIETAIENHEEEMRVLMAQASAEFGGAA